MKRIFGISIIAIFAIVAFAWVNHHNYLGQSWKVSADGEFTVHKGESPREVIRRLSKKINFGSEERLFRYAQFYGLSKKIRYGKVIFPDEVTFYSLFEALGRAQAEQITIQHIEGKNIYDFARVLEKSKITSFSSAINFLKNEENVKKILGEKFSSFEGYLYPDTYRFNQGVGVETIVSKMVSRFKEMFSNVPDHTHKLTDHQIVTLASIIEKETGAGFERPMISSVFHNRMKKGMKLETDPTVMYGILVKTDREITNIKRKHLKDDNPYNTYLIRSLPPGPIASPGKEALEAAVSPEKTEFLFFVSKNNGTHKFTKSYKEHLKAVRGFQLDPKAREGKSWRDLKKVEN